MSFCSDLILTSLNSHVWLGATTLDHAGHGGPVPSFYTHRNWAARRGSGQLKSPWRLQRIGFPLAAESLSPTATCWQVRVSARLSGRTGPRWAGNPCFDPAGAQLCWEHKIKTWRKQGRVKRWGLTAWSPTAAPMRSEPLWGLVSGPEHSGDYFSPADSVRHWKPWMNMQPGPHPSD